MGYLETLRTRAEQNLKTTDLQEYSKIKLIDLIKKVDLYKTELEIQCEDLIGSHNQMTSMYNKYYNLYNLSPIPYCTLNINGLIIEANNAMGDLIEVNHTKLINKSLRRYISPSYQYVYSPFIKEVFLKGGVNCLDIQILTKHRHTHTVQLLTKVIEDDSEPQLLVYLIDVFEYKKANEVLHKTTSQLSLSERKFSISELASTISHELNHPLGVMTNFVQGCIRRLESGNYNIEEILNVLKKVSDQIHRSAQIILRMKNLIYKGDVQKELTDLDAIISETIVLLNYESIDYPVSINYRAIANKIELMVDKVAIQQVLINLGRNAIEAMRDHNVIDPKLIIEVNLINKNMIEVSIYDNGPGLNEELRSKLFTSQFSTKSYGLGLGLAISQTIIQGHKGKLFYETANYKGGCFKFTLPLSN